MVIGGRHMAGDVRIVTRGPGVVRAWRVENGHTFNLTKEEARQALLDHLKPVVEGNDRGGCGCISTYPRPPWHKAEDHGCSPIEGGDTSGHWDMTWQFRKEGIVSGNPTDPRQLQHVVEHTLNWELAKLPNTLTGEDLEMAETLLVRARANIEAAIALITTGLRERDPQEETEYPNDRPEEAS